MGGEAAPAPLVLQLIEDILGIRPIPVELAEAEDLVIQVGHEHGILVAGDALPRLTVGFNEPQQLLTILLLTDQHLPVQGTAQDDNPALGFPASERQRAVDSLPALAGIRPARNPEQALNMAFDVLRQTQREQI